MKREKLLALFGSICLVLILVVSLTGWAGSAGTAGAVGSEGSAGPAGESVSAPTLEKSPPASIMPVVVLEGSDYEMGYQYYQQLFYVLGPWALEQAAHAPFTMAELTALQVHQYYIKLYYPELIEMFKGMAAGATDVGVPLSYTEVLARYTGTKSYPSPPPEAEEEELPPDGEGCSVWAAWGKTTTDGRLICADSMDGGHEYGVVIVAFPDEGNNFVACAKRGGLPSIPAMNSKGIFIGLSSGFAQRDIDRARGWDISVTGLINHQLRFGDSAEEVKDMRVAAKYGGSMSFTYAGLGGDVYVVEMTAACTEVRQPGEYTTGEEEYGVGETDFIYASNNYFSEMGLVCSLGDVFTEHAGWFQYGFAISPTPRNLEMWNMFHNYQGEVDLEFAKMMWRHPGTPPPYPLDTDAYYDPAASGEGWDNQICNLDTWYVGIGLPDDGDEGEMYICTGSAGRVAYPLGPTLHHQYYRIAGTNSFYQIVLASSPRKVVSAANDEAKTYIADAYQELMWLNYTDTGFTGLNELYSLANAEYYEGVLAYDAGRAASGSETLLYFSRALTAFTRSQAHAKQILHALVPPATSPEDLGLRPWFGFWGDWATRDIYPD